VLLKYDYFFIILFVELLLLNGSLLFDKTDDVLQLY